MGLVEFSVLDSLRFSQLFVYTFWSFDAAFDAVGNRNLFHPFQPFMIGQKCFAPKMAAKFNIPLIFYGENEAEYGNPLLDNASAKRSSEYFSTAADNQIFLAGESIDNLKTDFGMNASDLEPFLPIDSRQLESSETEVHYLGYYLKWHPQETYYFAIKNGNFTPSPERTAGTYFKICVY